MERLKMIHDMFIAIWQTVKPYVDNLPTDIETWSKLTDEMEKKKKEISGLSSPEYKHEAWLFDKMAADVMLYLGQRSKNK